MQSMGYTSQTIPFPNEKMNDYIEEYQNIINHFAGSRENPNRPSPSSFAKKLKPSQPREDAWKPNVTLRNYIKQEK